MHWGLGSSGFCRRSTLRAGRGLSHAPGGDRVRLAPRPHRSFRRPLRRRRLHASAPAPAAAGRAPGRDGPPAPPSPAPVRAASVAGEPAVRRLRLLAGGGARRSASGSSVAPRYRSSPFMNREDPIQARHQTERSGQKVRSLFSIYNIKVCSLSFIFYNLR